MVTANDIGRRVRYVVGGVTVVEGRLVCLSREGWATIRELQEDGIHREDQYRVDLCEVAYERELRTKDHPDYAPLMK